MTKEQLSIIIKSAENHHRSLADAGIVNTENWGTQFAEHVSAELCSELNKDEYLVAEASNKGFDISTKNHKIEVKSVFGEHRNIYNLKDKSESDQIIVIWFNTDSFIKVDRVIIYDTDVVMESVKKNGGKRGLFTRKSQNIMRKNGIGIDVTDQFQKLLNKYSK